MTSTDKASILTHLLDAHVHLAVAYFRGTGQAGESGLSALHKTEEAIREISQMEVNDAS